MTLKAKISKCYGYAPKYCKSIAWEQITAQLLALFSKEMGKIIGKDEITISAREADAVRQKYNIDKPIIWVINRLKIDVDARDRFRKSQRTKLAKLIKEDK